MRIINLRTSVSREPFQRQRNLPAGKQALVFAFPMVHIPYPFVTCSLQKLYFLFTIYITYNIYMSLVSLTHTHFPSTPTNIVATVFNFCLLCLGQGQCFLDLTIQTFTHISYLQTYPDYSTLKSAVCMEVTASMVASVRSTGL